MRVVGIGVEEADRDRLDALAGQDFRGAIDVLDRDRPEHAAAAVDPLANRQAEAARHHGPGRGVFVVVEPFADTPAHRQRIAETGGGQQPGLRPLSGEDGIGGHRGPVDDADRRAEQRPEVERFAVGEIGEPPHHGFGRVVRGRQRLVDAIRPAVALEVEIGERAAHIDADAYSAPGSEFFCRYFSTLLHGPDPA